MNHTPQDPPATLSEEGFKTINPRKRMLQLFAASILSLTVGSAAYYYFEGRFYEHTEDAYVGGNIVQITPQIAGTVIAVNAQDTQAVKIGESLVLLDASDAKIALDQAKAALGQAVRQVRVLYANNHAQQASVEQYRADLLRAQHDLRRRQAIAFTGAISKEELAHSRQAVQLARAALTATEQRLASNLVLTDRTTVKQHPNVLAAKAKVREAYLNLSRTQLPAPVDGWVAKSVAQVGQRVAPGAPLMAIVPLNQVWVDANFKEAQLANMKIGQSVKLTADAYGRSVVFHGRVTGFSAGTGSAFSLLPAQNATGNWIKIVQRLPVRITLDEKELANHPLRIGLSMQVKVDIHPLAAGQFHPISSRYQTRVFEEYGQEAEAEIQRIIRANMSNSSKQNSVRPNKTD